MSSRGKVTAVQRDAGIVLWPLSSFLACAPLPDRGRSRPTPRHCGPARKRLADSVSPLQGSTSAAIVALRGGWAGGDLRSQTAPYSQLLTPTHLFPYPRPQRRSSSGGRCLQRLRSRVSQSRGDRPDSPNRETPEGRTGMRLDSHARPRQLKAESAFGPSPNRREAGSRTLFSSMSPWVRRIDGDSEKLNSPSRLIRRHATLTETCRGKDRRFIDILYRTISKLLGTLVSHLSTALSQERGSRRTSDGCAMVCYAALRGGT
jgi:hypothetical protein